jgi:shikimate 5-dehydrogenase
LCESFTGLTCRSPLAGEFNNSSPPLTNLKAISLQSLQTQIPFDLIINATSLGHSGNHPGLPLSIFHPASLCYDLNYSAAAEPLQEFCLEAKINYQDGLGMLVEQAALSFELWTGRMPDTAPVLNQL